MANLTLSNARTALLSMDFHTRIVNASPMTVERNLVQNARKALDAARKSGIPVLHVVVHPNPFFMSPRNKFMRRIRENMPISSPQEIAELMKIVPELAPTENETVVEKPRIGAFAGSNLETLLRSKDIDTLVLMGAVTEFVIESTARYAIDYDYRVIILEDCCIGFSYEAHNNSIKILEHMTDIASCADFVESV